MCIRDSSNSAKKYLNKYGVSPGKNLVFFTNNDSAYETAIDFFEQGIKVEAIVDARDDSDGYFPKKANKLGITILKGYEISDTVGRLKIREIKLKKITTQKSNEKSSINIKCDLLAIAGGWTPTVHLFTQSKGKLKFRDSDGSFIPSEVYQDTLCVGSCNGDYNLNEILLKTQEDTYKYLNDNQRVVMDYLPENK